MRRNLDKRAKKTKAPAKKKKEPETFEEFMDEAIHNEEQGERYQTGDKAQRNYERAADMYGKASAANPKDADCVYNWGRVLFLLVNFLPSHASPEEKLEKVDQSIEKFRVALDLEPNKTDAQFNLAQALHQRSEILQETTEIENAYAASAVALQEAITLFDSVYDLQEKEYLELNSPATMDKTADEEEDEEHQHSHEPEQSEKSATASPPSEEFTTVTKVEPTTAYSLIETLLSTSETMTTMASMLASYPASMDLFSRAKSKLAAAEKWYSQMPNESTDDNMDAEKQKKAARIQINLKQSAMYAAMADRSFLATGVVDSSLFEKSIEQLNEIVTNYDKKNVEALCDRGDVMSSFGQAIREVADKKKTALNPDTDGKEVWKLYANAMKSFQEAMALEPKNTQILNKMGDLSITRAALDLPVAQRNRRQLLDNAKVYYRNAVQVDRDVLTSGYLGWAMTEWALEEWADVPDKKEDAIKIIEAWIKRGGTGALFSNLADDNDVLDEDFVEFITESCFADEED
ncbi:hypothetical protein V8B55DRAFT_1348115 [Mucor lusitanicus]|uniref:Uncharacterized protein n=2 Tax=Mucor circinelloides f. lusitanicus TaxID=29924 RepID=A0A168KKC2_MUCCL|nr:hypothetical protein FB192DRAFT_1014106 [Mucor lusitanicus]OAD02491.1 hypothetical protein MUCCIDRAFT_111878 [Mucor lusitanicus CBS 277.49]